MTKIAIVAVALGLLAACAPDPGSTPDQRVYNTTLDAWYARDYLPPIDDRYSPPLCADLDAFVMWAPATVAEYERICPAESWACLEFEAIRGVRNRQRPVAVMHPRLSAARWAAHGVHELLHQFRLCARLGRDYGHTDARVWRPSPDSVEARALGVLYLD